jgi:hypothetical protein
VLRSKYSAFDLTMCTQPLRGVSVAPGSSESGYSSYSRSGRPRKARTGSNLWLRTVNELR